MVVGEEVRTELQFDEAHIPDSVSITALRAGFGSKLAWLVEPGQVVVLVGRDDEDARAAALAESVGVTRLAGFLAGGMTSWREERRRSSGSSASTWRGCASAPASCRLDVRERDEWDSGHIPGSVHMPYHDIQGVPEGIDPERPVAVICSPASAPRRRPACCVATACARCCTWWRAAYLITSPCGHPARTPDAGWPRRRPT